MKYSPPPEYVLACEEEMETFKKAINADPINFIAPPIINLSSTPYYINAVLQPRRVDLRPFALCGPDGVDIVPGGLTPGKVHSSLILRREAAARIRGC